MLYKRNFYINGKWSSPNDAMDFNVIDPSTEQTCAVISLGSVEDTNRAVAAAKAAFPAWANTPREDRLNMMKKLLNVYKRRYNEMAEVISLEMGAPIDMATSMQAERGEAHLRACIEAFEAYDFEYPLRDDTPGAWILKEPIGVCGLIAPWNWPMNQVMLKCAPAIAVGCTVVLKPSEISPLSAMMLAEMIDEVGFPPGVFNLLNGDGLTVGNCLTSHPDVDMISFTGSTQAGIAISKSAANTVKRVALELGGKGANIIFADASEGVVTRGIRKMMTNSGQSCNAPSRMLVERSIYDDAITEAIEAAENIRTGPASEQGDHIGPVVSEQQFNKIQALIKLGINEGARLIVGGLGRPEDQELGYFVRPTIFADVDNNMSIAQEEIFGPVLVIIPFDTEDEAIEIANNTPYGLANLVHTSDTNRARRVTRGLRSGMVDINEGPRGFGAPFGGYKQSGNGREGGLWGIGDFLEIKSVGGWTG